MNPKPETVNDSAQHPLAGTLMSGADMIVQVLADEGVDTIFGYSGGAILPTYDAVFRFNDEHCDSTGNQPMPLIVPANEQGAGFMAAGYARASGKVGVVMVTSGPGATNTATPVRDCLADSVPIVVICGQVPTTAIGTDAFQEAPVSASLGPLSKHLFLVTDPAKLEATVRTAFEIARTGRPGPVVIDVPKDVQNAEETFKGSGLLPVPGYRHRMDAVNQNVLDDEGCANFYTLLKESRRPLIYAGGGVINSESARILRDFSDHFRIPVATTLMGIGAYDTTRDLSLQMLGMHGTAFANYAVEDCDMVIAVGTRFDDRVAAVPEKFAPQARAIAQFDIDPSEIGKVKEVDWFHVGILDRDFGKILEYGKHENIRLDLSDWHTQIARLKQEYALNYDRESELIQPYAVIEEINSYTRGEAIISTGVGQHQMWAAQHYNFTEPRSLVSSGGAGSMGFEVPGAMGAQVGRPD
ncbi:MAG: thiamine pyrophosphate-binding protein, partial [Gammaproteobacteria bacterium]|nr:thiamine pyrophosphate-binding protein [Gammaproteobacteria bacterium]